MAALKALAEPGDYEDPADVDDFADAVPVAEAGSRKQKPKATSQGMVMLIDNGDATSKGVAMGVMSLSDARSIAHERNLSLTCVASRADPPVYKMMAVEDIEAMEADAQQKKREAVQREREAQQSVKRRERAAAKITKELKMTAMVEKHDRDHRLKRAREFLGKGLRVKFTLFFKRNQPKDRSLQEELMKGLIVDLADYGKPISPPERGGPKLSCTLESLNPIDQSS